MNKNDVVELTKIVAFIFSIRRSKFGLYIYAIGDNVESAKNIEFY